jgi:hypothetical protein
VVGRDKSAPSWIVISRVEIIEFRFSIVVIASVTDRIVRNEAISYKGCCGAIAPGIITIVSNFSA